MFHVRPPCSLYLYRSHEKEYVLDGPPDEEDVSPMEGSHATQYWTSRSQPLHPAAQPPVPQAAARDRTRNCCSKPPVLKQVVRQWHQTFAGTDAAITCYNMQLSIYNLKVDYGRGRP